MKRIFGQNVTKKSRIFGRFEVRCIWVYGNWQEDIDANCQKSSDKKLVAMCQEYLT